MKMNYLQKSSTVNLIILVNKIRSNGIPVTVFQDDQKHETPDSYISKQLDKLC